MKKKSKALDKKAVKNSKIRKKYVKNQEKNKKLKKLSLSEGVSERLFLTKTQKLFFSRLRNNIVYESKRYFFVAHKFGYEFSAAAR